MTVSIQLLGTKGCHLCDVAERMVRRLAPECGVRIEYVDIAEDEALVEEFGMRIPIVRSVTASAQVLGWPFEEEDFIVWAKQLA